MKAALVIIAADALRTDAHALGRKLKSAADWTVEEIHPAQEKDSAALAGRISSCDALILVCPAAYGSVSSGTLRFLSEMQYALRKDLPFAAVVFADEKNEDACRSALRILKCFAERNRLCYCGGIGFGEAGLIPLFARFRSGPFRGFRKACAAMKKALADRSAPEERYEDFHVPGMVYAFVRERMYRSEAVRNGLRPRQIKAADKAAHYL